MNRTLRYYAPLVGRIFMGGFFLWNGIQGVLNFLATTDIFIKLGFPQPVVFAAIACTIEVLGGIALVVGYKTRLAAGLLIIYSSLVSAITFDISSAIQTQLFLANTAIVGGLLYICAYGAGRFSQDR